MGFARRLNDDTTLRPQCKDALRGGDSEMIGARKSKREPNRREVGTHRRGDTDLSEGEQHGMEPAPCELEDRYRSLVEDTDAGIVAIDVNASFIYVNRALCEMLGHSESEIVGHFFTAFTHPGDRTSVLRALQQALKYPRRRVIIDFRPVRKNSLVLFMRCRPTAVRHGDKITGLNAIITDVTEQKRAQAQLAEYQKELRSLASQLSLAEERERRRIAIALHERVAQDLALCRIKLGELSRSVPSCDQELNEIQNVVKELIKETRSLTFELSPPHLYDMGLEPALEELTHQMGERYGLSASFEDDGQTKPMSSEVRVLLFQMVRELLVNIVKHAKAHRSRVCIRSSVSRLRITVEDDGVGFDPSGISSGRRTKGFGLFSIRERLGYIGGQFRVESKRGRGTKITLVAPLQEDSNRGTRNEHADSSH